MPQVHNFTTPAAFCGSVSGHPFASKDPKAMKKQMEIALSAKTPGFFHNVYSEDQPGCTSVIPDSSCNIENLPDIIITYPSSSGDQCTQDITAFLNSINIGDVPLQSSLLTAFAKLLEIISSNTTITANAGCDDLVEFRVVFDKKVVVSWGTLKYISGTTYVLTPHIFSFPTTFNSFEFVLYFKNTSEYLGFSPTPIAYPPS